MLTGDIAYLRPGPFYNTAAQTAQEAYDPRRWPPTQRSSTTPLTASSTKAHRR
ncbi:MAG: hypothetical protein JKP95_00395 [Oceanicaulis sp.]|nr:hypothetical protein [Oceanicaulis sp.]